MLYTRSADILDQTDGSIVLVYHRGPILRWGGSNSPAQRSEIRHSFPLHMNTSCNPSAWLDKELI